MDRLRFLRRGLWTLFAGMRSRCARIHLHELELGMILGVLFACRMRGGLLVLVWGSFWGWDMYGRILFENEGEGGGGLYLITLFFCWIAPSSRAIYYLDSFSQKELWKEGAELSGKHFLKRESRSRTYSRPPRPQDCMKYVDRTGVVQIWI